MTPIEPDFGLTSNPPTFEQLLTQYKETAHALVEARFDLPVEEAVLESIDALLWNDEAVLAGTNDRQRKAAHEALKNTNDDYLAQRDLVRQGRRQIAEYEIEERIARKRIDMAIASQRLSIDGVKP